MNDTVSRGKVYGRTLITGENIVTRLSLRVLWNIDKAPSLLALRVWLKIITNWISNNFLVPVLNFNFQLIITYYINVPFYMIDYLFYFIFIHVYYFR